MKKWLLLVLCCSIASAQVQPNPPGVYTGTFSGSVSATSLTAQPVSPVTDAGNVGYTLLQSGLAFILTNVSGTTSCLVGTTGALSSCTTLPKTYSYALMYFPQGVLNVTASTVGYTAGWYYVNMTSTTAGQACLNGATTTAAGYVSGSPIGVTSCTAPTNAINSATYTVPLNTAITGPLATLPANATGVDGTMEVVLNTAEDTSASVKSFVTNDGTTNPGTSALNTLAPTTAGSAFASVRLTNTGNGKAQASNGFFSTSATTVTLSTGGGGSFAIDTTVTNYPNISLMLATGATSAYAILQNYSFRVYPN